MAWHDEWMSAFAAAPSRPGSREESVQVVLEELLLGLKPAWFTPYPPTARGRAVLEQVWRRAFGDNPDVPIGSLISEYELPVPIEWRTEIGYTYRCPDFACFAGQHLLLIELKTERSSYSRQQLVDYLRLARRMNPGAHIDLLLLAGHRPHAQLELGERQRYAEMTWDELADILSSEHGTRAAAALCHFIAESLMTSPATATPDAAVEQAPVDDQVLTAVDQALRIAAALEENARSRSIARGIDVPFPSTSHARHAGTAVRAALAGAGYAQVTTWLWQTSSGGQPTTPAGHSTGMELRLAPTRQ